MWWSSLDRGTAGAVALLAPVGKTDGCSKFVGPGGSLDNSKHNDVVGVERLTWGLCT